MSVFSLSSVISKYVSFKQRGAVKKDVFIIFVQGEHVREKIRKVCEGWETWYFHTHYIPAVEISFKNNVDLENSVQYFFLIRSIYFNISFLFYKLSCNITNNNTSENKINQRKDKKLFSWILTQITSVNELQMNYEECITFSTWSDSLVSLSFLTNWIFLMICLSPYLENDSSSLTLTLT